MTEFQEKVFRVVREIFCGEVMTYKEVARAIGAPKAYRAVGNALNKSASWRTNIPCHRVIRSDGTIGGYNQGVKRKIELLKKEGACYTRHRHKGRVIINPRLTRLGRGNFKNYVLSS